MKICGFVSNEKVNNYKRKQQEKYNENLELVAKHINADTSLKKKAVIVLGSIFYVQDAVNAVANLDKLNKAGNTIIGIVRDIAYWVCFAGFVIDIIKSLMQGDTKSIGKIGIKYGIAFSSLYIFPWVLDLIKDIFV